MIGTVLGGRYELLELVGTGGMAHVYKAKCRTLNRFVAIKILKDEYKDDKEFVKKFYVESQSAASLSNVNIASIYDVGEEAGMNYIVMEYIEGVTLKDVIKKNKVLQWEVALNCGLQILNALECAHKNGIVHRDIKPQNIICTYDGILKVADFGIAKAINGNETKKIDESVIGSVHYISPEQAKGIMIDARSDIYSLGIVMYEMLTGKLPFEGENPVSVALMHLNSEPESIKELNISVPLELCNIVHKAMKRDIAQRYQSAKEMANDLIEFKKQETVNAPDLDVESSEHTKILVKASAEAAETEKEITDAETLHKKSSSSENIIVKKAVKEQKEDEIISKDKPKKQRTKQEKIAVYSAFGVSALIITGMIILFLNIFFPNLKMGDLFKSKEYYLEDYRGKDADTVKAELEEIGFTVELQEGFDEELGDNEIISQRPSSEMNVKVKGTTVYFVVNTIDEENQKDKLIEVPSVVGSEIEAAKKQLIELGFKVNTEEEESETVTENNVIRQEPGEGSKLKAGSTVTLYVSKVKEEPVKVPDLKGKTRSEAKAMLEALGLMMSVTESDEGAENAEKVVSQSIAAETEVEKGATVSVVVGRKVETPVVQEPVTAVKTFKIQLPEAEKSRVLITKDGVAVYDKTHTAEEKTISVSVSGSGTQHITITVNGQEFLSQNVKFN